MRQTMLTACHVSAVTRLPSSVEVRFGENVCGVSRGVGGGGAMVKNHESEVPVELDRVRKARWSLNNSTGCIEACAAWTTYA